MSLAGWRQALDRGAGRVQTLGHLLEALLEAGLPALVILTGLLYSSHLSDYMTGKLAALHVMGGLLAGLWLVRAAVAGRLRAARAPLYLPFLVYLAISLVSLALAQNRGLAAEVLLTQVWLFLFCVLAMHHCRDRAVAAGVMWTVVLTGWVVAGLGVLQYNGVHLIPVPESAGNLPVSTLGNPNFVAHYLDLVIPLTAAMLLVRRRWWRQAVLALALVTMVFHLMLTSTRAGWLATGVGLLFLGVVLLGRKLPRQWGRRALLAALVAALLSPVAGLMLESVSLGGDHTLYDSLAQVTGTAWDRALTAFDPGDFSVSQRRIIWEDSLDLIRAHPLLGVGPGNYELFLPAFRSIDRHRAWSELMGERRQVAYQAHDEYLEWCAESGIFGLAAMLWLLAVLVWSGVRFLHVQAPPEVRAAIAGCLASLVAALVHSFFSFNLQDPGSAVLFWLLGGVMVAMGQSAEEADKAVEIPLGTAGRRLGAALVGTAVVLAGVRLGLGILLGDYYYFQGLRSYYKDGHPNRASLAFAQASSWRGYEFRYPHMLGLVSLESGRLPQAEAALKRSLELHPNNGAALRLLGEALTRQGKGEEAAGILKKAVSLEPLRPEGYRLLALAWSQQGDHDRAVEAWKQALNFWPEDASMLMELGLEYEETGQTAEAAVVLERAAQLTPQNSLVQGNLGAVYLKLGRLDEAQARLQQAISLSPDNQVPWRGNLAALYLRQGRLTEAAAQVDKLLQLDPQDRRVQTLAQELRRRLGKDQR